ncbi:MAG: DUF5689 domain-containing protein [Flavobacteriaceae bacterium]
MTFASILYLFLYSCGLKADFEPPNQVCNDSVQPNISYEELNDLLGEERVIEVNKDIRIEGYVISSDRAGNFFRSLHLQEKKSETGQGIQIEIDLTDLHLLFPIGTRVLVNLRGLYLGKSNGVYKLGSAINNFGSLGISRLPGLVVQEHIFVSCGKDEAIEPTIVNLDSLNEKLINTFVELVNVQFSSEELGKPYALQKEETYRTLYDCTGRTIELKNSGYSDFYDDALPEGNGNIRGILHRNGKDFVIVIRDTGDIDFSEQRCRDSQELISSDHIYISEIADPENRTDARFVELYNSGQDDIPLNGWKMNRYTNDNTEVGSSIDLTGQVIKANRTILIAADSAGFELVYGFKPDLVAGSNTAAGSNGDDNLELVDPFDKVIDRFGVPGEDGSGTNHEFEDGGAFRRMEIMMGRPEYLFEEWIIFNDSGESGTIRQPLLAPQDFNPGER